ncbi:glycoside hydrolase [Dendryphion nanum]|uniref:Mannosyl-oligosaccharide glucosidase n=1 Tax=Dendryphion nanum TaxID=256645 RepID=A0A9P9DU85_9PLEO|nr:glycoside hydrolase [Dendryphion nanum]
MELPTALISLLLALLQPTPIIAESLPSNNASLLWGPYRSNLYFGIRPRAPENLLLGLMWGKQGAKEQQLRHDCSQNDGMAGYGWTTYDARRGGSQVIHDAENMVDIFTDFAKPYEEKNAGNWGFRVRGKPRVDTTSVLKTSVVFYVGTESNTSCPKCYLRATVEEQGRGDDISIESVNIQLNHPRLGKAMLRIPKPKVFGSEEMAEERPRNPGDIFVKSFNATDDELWQAKSLFIRATKDRPGQTISIEPGLGNFQMVQIVFTGEFEFDVLYSSDSAAQDFTSSDFDKESKIVNESFHEQFRSVFSPRRPFTNLSTFAEHMTSNLFGGLSHFYGKSKVDDSHDPAFNESVPHFWQKVEEAQRRSKPKMKGPYELFTHVPSRPFFPRGFLWDEGFHLLAVIEWDVDLAMEVVRSWLALMDDDGWIAREQILGAESRSKVPEQFHVQYPHIANPPTLFWVVEKFAKMLSGDLHYSGHASVFLTQPETGRELLKELHSLLKRHYQWFKRTQSGDVEAHSVHDTSIEGYRWRGRTPEYAFASGLDDYPRAEPPDISELHVDALCWVGLMASVLVTLSHQLDSGPFSEKQVYESHYQDVAHNLELLHWSESEYTYCDARIWEGAHTLCCPKGYVSLFPFMTGFIGPEHPHLNATLNIIRDPHHLWSPHGIRSLGFESTRYGQGDNYWRSPIWININYLIVKQLLDLAQQPGPEQARCKYMYRDLRENLVNTVYKSWVDTGFAWEQYNPSSGHGQRTQHFTGWTALIVLIMAMPDLYAEETEESKEFGNRISGLLEQARQKSSWSTISSCVTLFLLVVLFLTRRRTAKMLRGFGGYLKS